jgi:hypothetical protein
VLACKRSMTRLHVCLQINKDACMRITWGELAMCLVYRDQLTDMNFTSYPIDGMKYWTYEVVMNGQLHNDRKL